MKSNISTVVSSFELNYLQNKNINCELLPLFRKKNQKKSKTFDERNGLVFIAGFNHLPNQDALTYFLDDFFLLSNSICLACDVQSLATIYL